MLVSIEDCSYCLRTKTSSKDNLLTTKTDKFFGDYWISIGNAAGLVEGNVGEIVKVIDTAVQKKK